MVKLKILVWKPHKHGGSTAKTIVDQEIPQETRSLEIRIEKFEKRKCPCCGREIEENSNI